MFEPGALGERGGLGRSIRAYGVTDKEIRISLSVAQVFKIGFFNRRECIIYFYLRQSL